MHAAHEADTCRCLRKPANCADSPSSDRGGTTSVHTAVPSVACFLTSGPTPRCRT